MAVKATELMNDLHIDESDSETNSINSLITQATDLVKSSVNYGLSDEDYAKYPLFDAAVKELTTALYYDRTLANGMPHAVTIMITHLQARLGGKNGSTTV
ncbi:phage gp6-like head-tail connector protein [Weissella paramesenteroides]|uniref:head-tail connector protein n=1 Tax=Weissella paramesenteroides TaxID=1249 RepID=UPI002402B749|nr:head-tail connector protein [Weissella paramesenteroides]MDF8366176.1 phage gp6-like head-tail connector protein [Weissella paramesenteroides]